MQNGSLCKNHTRISRRVVKALLFEMMKIRAVEEEIARHYPEQEMRCPVHLCVGQEATPAAVCANLTPRDIIFSAHRSHGYYIARGAGLGGLFAELFGRQTGCTGGKGGSQHLAAPEVGFLGSSAIVAGTIPIAAGAALSMRMQRRRSVVVASFGDGAADQGVFYESLNFSALQKLPMLFVCENNLYATHAHQSARQALDNIHEKAAAFGVESVRVSGNDVQEVFLACRQAIAAARAGGGPRLIECRTYRWLEHVGPNYDYDLGYRSRAELERWQRSCPIRSLAGLLLKKQWISPDEIGRQEARINQQIQEALSFARKSLWPGEDELLAGVYCGGPGGKKGKTR